MSTKFERRYTTLNMAYVVVYKKDGEGVEVLFSEEIGNVIIRKFSYDKKGCYDLLYVNPVDSVRSVYRTDKRIILSSAQFIAVAKYLENY